MKKTSALILFAGLALVLNRSTLAAASDLPRVFRADPRAMAAERERTLAGDPALAPALKHLRGAADKALKHEPYTVTEKKRPSPTGDLHDYISLAPYFWPNPNTPDGLPYVRHDGRHNPETKDYDAPNFGAMSSHSYDLALAYYLTGNEAYAEHAALFLRTWFLDSATKMNPNFDHAQLVKGVNNGRGTGVLEADRLLGVVDAVGLLRGCKAWTPEDQKGMESWFREFVRWMHESKGGKTEAAAKNNHGTWFDVQLVTYLLFIGDQSEARQILEDAKAKRIAAQIQPDGTLPLELARTNSLSYSVFDLTAFANLADLGRQEGVDLWGYKSDDGRSIRAALDYLLPYLTGEKTWEHEQIGKFSPANAIEPLRRAAAAYHEAKYAQAVEKLRGTDDSVKYDELRLPL